MAAHVDAILETLAKRIKDAEVERVGHLANIDRLGTKISALQEKNELTRRDEANLEVWLAGSNTLLELIKGLDDLIKRLDEEMSKDKAAARLFALNPPSGK